MTERNDESTNDAAKRNEEFLRAAKRNDIETLSKHLHYYEEHSISVDSIFHRYGNTAFIIACAYSSFESMELLLKAGAAINGSSKNNMRNPLSASDDIEVFKWLINSRGANYNYKNAYGVSVLMDACYLDHREKVLLLLQYQDININDQNFEGYTALHICVISESNKCLELILNDGRCDKTILYNEGLSAECIAISMGNNTVAEYIRNYEHICMY